MKLYLDSANIKEVETMMSYGIIDGVTTNPSLLKKALPISGLNITQHLRKLCKIMKGKPVSIELTQRTHKEMVKQARNIIQKVKCNNIVIKVPVCTIVNGKETFSMDGIKTIKSLSECNIEVNTTLIFTPEQALLAAKAGAKYVSPFTARMDDYLRDTHRIKYDKKDYYPFQGKKNVEDEGIISGIDLVQQCVDILESYNTEVLAASVRNTQQLRECSIVGADIITVPYTVLQLMVVHPKTMQGMKQFDKDSSEEYKAL
jgi:transaldolase